MSNRAVLFFADSEVFLVDVDGNKSFIVGTGEFGKNLAKIALIVFEIGATMVFCCDCCSGCEVVADVDVDASFDDSDDDEDGGLALDDSFGS